jgi:hypothetical protein
MKSTEINGIYDDNDQKNEKEFKCGAFEKYFTL